jgi:hypothetical protein
MDRDQIVAGFEELVAQNQIQTAVDLLTSVRPEDQLFLVKHGDPALAGRFFQALDAEERLEVAGNLDDAELSDAVIGGSFPPFVDAADLTRLSFAGPPAESPAEQLLVQRLSAALPPWFRLTSAAFALLLVVGLVACGGNDDDRTSSGSAETNQTPGIRERASGTPRTTGQAGDSLARGLLKFEDMPAGWTFNAESAGSPEDTDVCGTDLASLEQHRQKLGEAAIGFQHGESGPFFAETLAEYPPGTAERVMTDLAAAVQSCPEVVIRDDEGGTSTWQLSPLTFPEFGDQTVAFREHWPANGVEAIIVYIRRQNRIMVLLHIAINSRVDRLQTETLAGRAYERFNRLDSGR